MRASRVPILVLIAGLGAACTKKGSGKDDGEAKAETRADKCERISKEVARTAQLAAGVMANALADDPAEGRNAAQEMSGEVAAMAAQMRADCMTWSEEQVKCLAEPVYALRHTEECERAMAAAMGEPLPPADVPEGPKPTWSHTFEGKPSTVRLRADGLVVARFSDYRSGADDEEGTWYRALVGVRDGEQVWAHEGEFDDNVVVVDDDTYVVVSEGKLRAIDPTTGETKWTWGPSAEHVEEFDPEWDSLPWVQVVADAGEGLLVGDTDARWYAVSDDGKTGKKVARLTDENLDSDARLFVGPDGRRWLWEGRDLRAFDAEWNPVVAVQAHTSLADVVVREDGVYLLVDGEVLALDPAKCSSDAEWISPSKWPHPGELTFSGEDECEGCGPAPSGCVKWQHYVEEVSHEPMGVLPDGTFAVSNGTQTFAFRGGAEVWKSATAAGGRTAAGRHVYAVKPGNEEEGPWKLWALDPATGAHQWGSTLSGGTDSWIYSTDEVHLHVAGDWVLAGYGPTIDLFRVRGDEG